MSSTGIAAVCAVALLAAGAVAAQQSSTIAARQRRIDANAEQALKALFAESAEVKALYGRAAGYAVFTATKAGFFVTGGSGTGVAVDKASRAHTYMRMGTGGIGLGIGAQRFSLVILFEDATHLQRFVKGGWDASATALAAAGKDGVAVRSSFVDGVAFYQLTKKGLMAQVDVSGTRFWVIDALNGKAAEGKASPPAARKPGSPGR